MLGGLALRGYEVNAQSPVYYTHGVASGDPLSDPRHSLDTSASRAARRP